MNRQLRLIALLVALAGSVLVAGQSPQPPSEPTPAQPTPTFRTQVEYVEVDALVTDQQGQFVGNLKREDFQVLEDGKVQKITTFGVVDIPIERADRPLYSPTAIEPDVQTNARPFDGRVYVMVLDDLHTAALRTQRVKIAARQFIQRNLGANDLMAVVFTGGRAQDAQEFTSNKRLLLAAVDKMMGRKLDSVTISRNEEYQRQRMSDDTVKGSDIMDPDEMERANNARSMLSSLRQVAEWFGGVHGRRKTLLLFSEGIDYDINNVIGRYDAPPSSASSIIADIQDAIGATARSNVSIYAIDPRGLTNLADDAIGVSSFADADDPQAGIGQRSLNNELRLSQDSLRTLADQSGGFAAVNRNDLGSAFERIVRDNSSYYLLAYYPPSDKRDGKFHRIEVKVNRPGLVVRARRGYASPKGKPAPKNTKTAGMSPELFDVINSPMPVSGLTLRVFAAPFKGTAPNSSVLVGVEMLGRDLNLESNNKIEISTMAIDAKTKVFGPRNDVLTVTLRPDTRDRVKESGIRLLNRMDLPAGRYQLRVATRDTSNSATGSVLYDLEVPDFYKEPMTVSGLTLTSLAGASMLTAKADDQLKDVLPAPPVSQRSFAQNDELALFAEIYDNSGNSPHKVDITTSVLTDEGRVLFKNEDERDSSELQGARGGYGYTTRVPLSEIAPGMYVLKVEARSRLGQNTAADRQVQIWVTAPDQADQR